MLKWLALLLSVVFFATLLSRPAFALPPEYMKNAQIRTETTVLGDEMRFAFGFNDPAGAYSEWSWQTSASALESSARAFGLSGRDPNNIQASDQELRAAYFKKHPMVGVMADFSRLVGRYHDSVADLHARWRQHVDERHLSRREALEVLLVFLQDFPYGRPGQVYEQRVIGDLFVPPLIFKNGWGDCDSKALLMATVLSHEEDYKGHMAMILVPGHAFLGIEMDAGPYDEIYEYQNRKYVVAEPTGLARTPLGRKNSPYSTVLVIEPLRLNSSGSAGSEISAPPPAAPAAYAPPASLDFTAPRKTEAPALVRELTKNDCGKSGVLLESTTGSPPVRVQSCYIAKGRDVYKQGPQVEFGSDGMPAKRTQYNLGKLQP